MTLALVGVVLGALAISVGGAVAAPTERFKRSMPGHLYVYFRVLLTERDR
jgi:hypothetical protein